MHHPRHGRAGKNSLPCVGMTWTNPRSCATRDPSRTQTCWRQKRSKTICRFGTMNAVGVACQFTGRRLTDEKNDSSTVCRTLVRRYVAACLCGKSHLEQHQPCTNNSKEKEEAVEEKEGSSTTSCNVQVTVLGKWFRRPVGPAIKPAPVADTTGASSISGIVRRRMRGADNVF